MREELKGIFASVFGEKEGLRFFSHSRVNLIGEHTDYNGGHVFPCALTMGTYAAVAERNDGLVRMYSDNFKNAGIKECSLGDIHYQKKTTGRTTRKALFMNSSRGAILFPMALTLYFQEIFQTGRGCRRPLLLNC